MFKELDTAYFRFPAVLMTHEKYAQLSPQALLVYMYFYQDLYLLAWTGKSLVKSDLVRESLNLSHRAFYEAIQELQAVNLVQVSEEGRIRGIWPLAEEPGASC